MEAQVNANHIIDTLCDIVPNPRRTNKDLQALLDNLERLPKDLVPFKGKILMHLNLHAHFNRNINSKLIAACYSKATLLFRKGINKDEGPLGSWKDAFRREVSAIEDNLEQLYQLVGVVTNRVVGDSMMSNADEAQTKEILSDGKENEDYRTSVDNYVVEIDIAANKICALISVQSDFDLPIPPLVLLKLASKICLMRRKDYRKSLNSLVKEYTYMKVLELTNIALQIMRTAISVLGTNMIPFMQLFNRVLLGQLEWTRTSGLVAYNSDTYHLLRIKLFETLTFALNKLALHVNFDSQQIQTLLRFEVMESLACPKDFSDSGKQEHIIGTLEFLECFYLLYSRFLQDSIDREIKSYVIHQCLDIYRDFDNYETTESYRYQLLNLLQIIANHPFASSTTEIANNIFELAEKFEPGARIKSFARRCILVGLAHRPIIVSRESVLELESDMFAEKSAAVIEPEQQEQLQLRQPSPSSPSLAPPSLTPLPTCPIPTSDPLPAAASPPAKAPPSPPASTAQPNAQPSSPASLPPPPTAASPQPPPSPSPPATGETRLALSPSLFHGLN